MENRKPLIDFTPAYVEEIPTTEAREGYDYSENEYYTFYEDVVLYVVLMHDNDGVEYSYCANSKEDAETVAAIASATRDFPYGTIWSSRVPYGSPAWLKYGCEDDLRDREENDFNPY